MTVAVTSAPAVPAPSASPAAVAAPAFFRLFRFGLDSPGVSPVLALVDSSVFRGFSLRVVSFLAFLTANGFGAFLP